MPITQDNFKNNILTLITDGSVQSGIFEHNHTLDSIIQPNGNHFIRMSVYENGSFIKSYFSNSTWNGDKVHYIDNIPYYTNQPYIGYSVDDLIEPGDTYKNWLDIIQLPVYKDSNGNVFVKPNDVFEKDPVLNYESGKYELRFDFVDSVFNHIGNYVKPKFWIKEISTSRKELRLLGINDNAGDETSPILLDTSFKSEYESWVKPGGIYSADFHLFNLNLDKHINNTVVINSEFDDVSLDTTSLVVRFNNSINNNISLLDRVDIVQEIYPSQTQEIIFFNEDYKENNINYLSPDTSIEIDNINSDVVQSYNDLIGSASLDQNQKSNLLNSIFSSSEDTLNIDFRNADNHTHFGSYEYKLTNFYSKIKKIEGYVNEISTSLFLSNSFQITQKEEQFKKIDEIVSNFTSYEKFLYNDYESTASYPNAGLNYSQTPPISGTFDKNYNLISGNSEIIARYDGIPLVYKVSTIGDTVQSGSNITLADSNYWDRTGSNWSSSADGSTIFYSASHDGTGIVTTSIATSMTYVDSESGAYTGLNLFDGGQSYRIEFDTVVSNVPGESPHVNGVDTGSITFMLGLNSANLVTFDITASGHLIGETISSISPPGGAENTVEISAQGDFSGSIDNILIRPMMDTDGRADIFTDTYQVENFPLSSFNEEFYMTFFAKWQEFPTWENHNVSGSAPIPIDAFQSRVITGNETPDINASKNWERYVIAVSQSYWKADKDFAVSTFTEDEARDNANWDIIHSGSDIDSYDVMHSVFGDGTELEPYFVNNKKAVLPTGELFRMYHITASDDDGNTIPDSPVTSSYLTDVKIFKRDKNYSGSFSSVTGSITDILPFSHLYETGSTIVQDWYSSSLSEAKIYDRDNVHSLYNNIPKHVREQDTDGVLEKYLALIGENYDVLKNYIDNYTSFHNRGYDNYNTVPPALLDIIGQNYGWNFINSNGIKSLLEYYVGRESAAFNYKDLTHMIWQNILNNLTYIYKTKGTERSVRALLNTFGLPPEMVSIDQVGGSDEKQQIASPGIFSFKDLYNGVTHVSGNLSYNDYNDYESFLSFDVNNYDFTSDWNTPDLGGSGSTTALQLDMTMLLSSSNSASVAVIAQSSGSTSGDECWKLTYTPGTKADSGSLGFYLNAATASSANTYLTDTDNPTILSSSQLPMASLNNDEIWSVLLQRTTAEDSTTHTYELYTGKKSNDKITHYWSGSLDVTGSTTSGEQANRNFSTGSEQTSDNLHFGVSGFTGSISEIKVWSGSISEQNFELSIADHNSVTGPNINSFKDLGYWYRFKGDYSEEGKKGQTATIKDVVKNNSKGNFSKQISIGKGNWTIKKRLVKNYQFSPRGLSSLETINKNKIRISKPPTLLGGGLNTYKSNIQSDDSENIYNETKRHSNPSVKLSISPTNAVNKFINYHVLDSDLGELLGDPSNSYTENFSELNALRLSIFNQYDGFAGVNQYMRNLSSLVPSGLWKAMSHISPAGVELSRAFVYESDILSRNKHPFGVDDETNLHEKYQKSNFNPNEFKVVTSEFTNLNINNTLLQSDYSVILSDDGNSLIDKKIDLSLFSEISSNIETITDSSLNKTNNQLVYQGDLSDEVVNRNLEINKNQQINSTIFNPDENINLNKTGFDTMLGKDSTTNKISKTDIFDESKNISYVNQIDFEVKTSDEINFDTNNSQAINENSFIINLEENHFSKETSLNTILATTNLSFDSEKTIRIDSNGFNTPLGNDENSQKLNIDENLYKNTKFKLSDSVNNIKGEIDSIADLSLKSENINLVKSTPISKIDIKPNVTIPSSLISDALKKREDEITIEKSSIPTNEIDTKHFKDVNTSIINQFSNTDDLFKIQKDIDSQYNKATSTVNSPTSALRYDIDNKLNTNSNIITHKISDPVKINVKEIAISKIIPTETDNLELQIKNVSLKKQKDYNIEVKREFEDIKTNVPITSQYNFESIIPEINSTPQNQLQINLNRASDDELVNVDINYNSSISTTSSPQSSLKYEVESSLNKNTITIQSTFANKMDGIGRLKNVNVSYNKTPGLHNPKIYVTDDGQNVNSKVSGSQDAGSATLTEYKTNVRRELKIKYQDKNNPNFTFYNSVKDEMNISSYESGSSAQNANPVSINIGDHERIWTRGHKRKFTEHYSWGNLGQVEDYLHVPYDNSKLSHYRGGTIFNEKQIGRTNWHTLHPDGNITLPSNHISNYIDKAWIEHFRKGTKNDGRNGPWHTDPLGEIVSGSFEDTGCKGAIWVKNVEDGKLRLKVERN